VHSQGLVLHFTALSVDSTRATRLNVHWTKVPDADDGAGGRLTWQTAGPFIATECVP